MIPCAAEYAGAAPAGRSVFPRMLSMRTVLWHGLACSAAGAVLAALSGILWQLVWTGGLDLPALAAVIFLGVAIATLAGTGVSLLLALRLHRLRRQLTTEPAAKPKPRHRDRLSARLGTDYRWTNLSPALCRLLRRSARSLRDRPVFETLHPEDFGVLDRALGQAQATGRPQIVACRFLVPLELAFGAFARTTFRSDTQLLPPLDPASFRHVRLAILRPHR